MTDTDTYLRDSYASRTAQYAALFADLDAYGEDRSAPEADVTTDEAIDQSILSIDSRRAFDVTISMGGPGEWLECLVDEDGDLTRVVFVAAWWSTPIRTTVHDGESLWRLAERMNPYQYES